MDKSGLVPSNDELFPTSVRLTIMILLTTHKKLGFTELQKLLHLTPGNLDHHVKKLIEANYVKTRRSLLTGRALTVIEITKHGEVSFKEYIKELRNKLERIK